MMDDYIRHPDYATAVDALADGVRNQTRPVIDCLGIRIKLAELESWGEYELLHRKMYSGFWRFKWYRLLFSKLYRKLYRSYIAAQLALQQEFLVKILSMAK